MTLRDLVLVVEPRTKVVSLTSFGLGVLYAAYSTRSFSWPAASVMLLAVLCVDMGTTAFNSFFDYERRVDEPGRNREADKVLVHRGVAPGLALLVGVGLYGLAAVLGLLLALMRGAAVIIVGAAGMAVGSLYNGGRRPISHTPLGELFAGGFLGSILFLISFRVQAGYVTPSSLLASLPLFLLVASILTVNNTCDMDGDQAAGRRTLSIVLGRSGGEALVYALGGLAYAVTAVEAAVGLLPLLTLAPLVASAAVTVAIYRRMHCRGFSHETKGPTMRAIVRALGLYGAAVGVPLLADLLIATHP